jgi:glycosyltransferase involved in cell wall biosynthesis
LHFQLGVFQHREREAMSVLMRRAFRNIDATVHDPPFVTFPYFSFRSKPLLRASRAFDWYLGSFGLQRRALEGLSRVFVLSETGRSALLRLAPKAEVIAIPHIVSKEAVWPMVQRLPQDLLYFGFIGPRKGLEYTLRLHRALLQMRPQTQLHVIGQPSGRSGERFYERLRQEYRHNVTFHGYLSDQDVDDVFAGVGHVVLPYRVYKYVFPASGSAIQGLRRARAVWTTAVNAMPELVEDGRNGFILRRELEPDAVRLAAVLDDADLTRRVSNGARQSALAMARYDYRRHFAT